ncbi:MAG: Cell division protein FtsP [Chlamydiales bacterium]|nr:Cell division protein FtsP [Chlamydiales bacterium]
MYLIFLAFLLFASTPPLPWEKAESERLAPAEPDRDYTPAVVPNGHTAEYRVVDGVKVFHLIAESIDWEFAEGLKATCWGYNGTTPGPLIEVGEGDQVRIYVTNRLPTFTTVHWHGVLLPCGMDGVSALTQPAIPPGETFLYEFIFPNAGTFLYHSHHDTMTQEGLGLQGMIIVHKREPDTANRPERDFSIMLNEMTVKVGTARPDVFSMGGFNILTMNGKVMPATEPLVAQIGETVWIRYGNLSAMDHHPIHLHGYSFKIIGTDGGFAPDRSVLMNETTVLVPTGAVRVIEFLANNPGDWIFHCHMTHHIMNQMGDGFTNTIGMEVGDLDTKISRLIPGYKTLGRTGMKDMTQSGRPIPENSIPMLGFDGQFGNTDLGGMANILRVREKLENYEDPGPYDFPRGSVAAPPTEEELKRDGIQLNAQ